MRRLLFALLALVCVATLLWRLGTGAWPGVRPDGPVRGRGAADEAREPELRGQPPEAVEDASSAPSVVPDTPPDGPHGTLTGRVVGLQEEPLPDAGVSGLGVFDIFGNASRYCSASAGADGRFLLYVKAGIPTIVVADAPGRGPVVGPRVQLEAGATRDVGTFRLAPERRLPVRVVDDKGTPVEDVEVWLTSETDPRPEGWDLALAASEVLDARATDADGRVFFDGLPAGTWRVTIDTGALEVWDQVREHVEANGEVVVFVLPSRSTPLTVRVHLKIVGPNGEPVPWASIGLEAQDSSVSSGYSAGSDESFELECGGGPVRLIVQEAQDADGTPLGYAPVVISDVRGLENPVVIRLERGATITGRVSWPGDPGTWKVRAVGWFDPDRRVCVPSHEAGPTHTYLSFDTQAEADGSFCLVGLPRGRFTVRASGPGRLRGPAPVVEAGATEVVLETVPEGQVEVHVLAPQGLPFGSAYLVLEEWVGEGIEGRGTWWGGGGERPDVRVYHLTDLRLDRRYRLRAYGNCSGVRCRTDVLDDVVPREAPYVLSLEETPRVRGVVEREDGTPVGGARVRYLPWPGGRLASNPNILLDGPWLWFSLSDAAGAFDLSGFGEQELVLGVTGLGLTLRDAPPRVGPGTSGIRLVVVPERCLSGRVVDPAGGTLAGLRAVAVPDLGSPRLWTPYRVAADGFFEVRGLVAGKYRVVIWNERDPTDLRSVFSGPLPAGQRDVRLELGTGAVLAGVVRDHAGRPVPGAQVRLRGRWTNRAASTDAEGRYAFTGIPREVELQVEVVTPAGRPVLRDVPATRTAGSTTLDVTLPKR